MSQGGRLPHLSDDEDAIVGMPIRARRRLFALLVLFTVTGATALMVASLSVGGFDGVDTVMTALFAVTLPWTAIGFWNAAIGLMVMRTKPDTARAVCPPLVDSSDRSPIWARTAILSCIRDEDIDAVGRNLDLMIADLVAQGDADRFHIFVLSDSHRPEAIAAEQSRIQHLAARWHGQMGITYRRREHNTGFKAGNIRDFCDRWGLAYDFMLVLDADSLMTANTILRMVRTMQAAPQLGILQTLVAGLPSASAFARPFQFGMRLGMKSYTIGSAWWQADAGPYWGHNALLRVAPFTAHCELPRLPGRGPLGGWILSHDQVEAALMRRAGFAVRVMPIESGSWEENPTTLPAFIDRDLRWCQGNLQYLKLLRLPGLEPVSRIQLALAILMFVASPAWVLLMLVGLFRLASTADPVFDPATGALLLASVLTMVFAPKLATLIDALATSRGRRQYGGAMPLLASSIAEVLFSALIAPIMAIAHTRFIGGLVFGRAVFWRAQDRALHRVAPRTAMRRLWPQTLVGGGALLVLGLTGADAALLLSPFYVGALLAVPIAVTTSLPRLGSRAAELRLWCTPDEVEPVPPIASLPLCALRRPTPVRVLTAAGPEPTL